MDVLSGIKLPPHYKEIADASEQMGFSMASDLHIGNLLRTLVSSKPHANVLEMGTGTGLSTAWLADGMDSSSTLITLDNDEHLLNIATQFFGTDSRIKTVLVDGATWIKSYRGKKFDLIFADTWPGKYLVLDHTLDLLKIGGLYIIDDMNPQPNWPEGHHEKASSLISYLSTLEDFNLTMLNWSTGIIIAVKIK